MPTCTISLILIDLLYWIPSINCVSTGLILLSLSEMNLILLLLLLLSLDIIGPTAPAKRLTLQFPIIKISLLQIVLCSLIPKVSS